MSRYLNREGQPTGSEKLASTERKLYAAIGMLAFAILVGTGIANIWLNSH